VRNTSGALRRQHHNLASLIRRGAIGRAADCHRIRRTLKNYAGSFARREKSLDSNARKDLMQTLNISLFCIILGIELCKAGLWVTKRWRVRVEPVCDLSKKSSEEKRETEKETQQDDSIETRVTSPLRKTTDHQWTDTHIAITAAYAQELARMDTARIQIPQQQNGYTTIPMTRQQMMQAAQQGQPSGATTVIRSDRAAQFAPRGAN
jgi:hypothetical protein